MSQGNFVVNFSSLFEIVPSLYIVVLPDMTVAAVTDEYLKATMRRREEVVGRDIFEVFPDNPDDETAHSVIVRRSFEKVFATGEPDELPVQKYDVERPGGGFEERYWSLISFPAFDEKKRVEYVIHRVEDITEQLQIRQKGVAQAKLASEMQIRVQQSESEKQQAENALEDARLRLESALDAGEIGTWTWDIINDRVFADKSLAKIFSVSEVDANGGKIENYIRAIYPDDRENVQKSIADAMRNADHYEAEYRILTAEKSIRWVVARGKIVRDAHGRAAQLPGVVIDITAPKLAQEMLFERARLAALNAAIGAALNKNEDLPELLKNCTDALVTHLDAAFARIWKFDKRENMLVLQASSGIYTHLDGTHSQIPVGQFKIGRIAEQRVPHLTNNVADDSQVSDQDWARQTGMTAFAGYPLLIEDRLVGVICIFSRSSMTDLTLQAMESVSHAVANGIERKQIENERQFLLAGEQSLRRSAEEANRMKDEFLATLSHELRTPLTSILGWSRMLGTHKLDAEQSKRALETIERNAKVQSQLIEDILDVSRIISGKLRLHVVPVDLSSVIADSVEAVRPAADAKEIRLQQILDSSVGTISGDPDRLQQIIWNLLSNSIKFTPKGGRVQIKLERVNSHVEIIVSDDGLGISAQDLPFVFERFRQSDSSTTRKHGGLGLGLAIVRHLVEIHGGSVSAASGGLNQGSVFTAAFPLMAVVPDANQKNTGELRVHPAVQTETAVVCPPELNGLRILVVDDEADTRTLIASIFRTCAAKITEVSSVREALEKLETDKFDVLVSDIGMPEHDGYELIKHVRALPPEKGGRIPAVALTAYARVEDRMRALNAGFQMHVPKPVEPAELLTIVASLAEWHKPAQTSIE